MSAVAVASYGHLGVLARGPGTRCIRLSRRRRVQSSPGIISYSGYCSGGGAADPEADREADRD
ncbi:hypothetical protein ACRE_061020 [Hapsidospora chrysogenum ATCC 11550]|uniref:Uncharacterized protein n=1 Tax=Hapsidospora chrysogenum (strain ATCC 11550 / CBS 779.69 / DSM 880 / IAM 14645 / JCM 23072 / IMI 49137) TaxID=857340 RepID=A0A086T1A7_HAPC1|nr:hypothetical protein ACRE_061020 [Hapsidospora chrysogenum ATCC 11550]